MAAIDSLDAALTEGALYRLPDAAGGVIVQAYRHNDPGLVWGLSAMLGGDGSYGDWYAVTEDGVVVRWWLCDEDPLGGFPPAWWTLEDLERWPPTSIR